MITKLLKKSKFYSIRPNKANRVLLKLVIIQLLLIAIFGLILFLFWKELIFVFLGFFSFLLLSVLVLGYRIPFSRRELLYLKRRERNFRKILSGKNLEFLDKFFVNIKVGKYGSYLLLEFHNTPVMHGKVINDELKPWNTIQKKPQKLLNKL